jgi:FkbM family methyltransferase
VSLEATVPALRALGPFDVVLDVGGNVGEWAGLARTLWPDSRLTSFEPVPFLAETNRTRAGGRWWVEPVALSTREGAAELRVCLNQHSASTMQQPGTLRRQAFGIVDRWDTIEVQCRPLDHYLRELPAGRLLVKVDVEGHEGAVLAGGPKVLDLADVVIVECQQSGEIFEGAATPAAVDELLGFSGLRFAGVLASLADPAGAVVQFDGIWVRDR